MGREGGGGGWLNGEGEREEGGGGGGGLNGEVEREKGERRGMVEWGGSGEVRRRGGGWGGWLFPV